VVGVGFGGGLLGVRRTCLNMRASEKGGRADALNGEKVASSGAQRNKSSRGVKEIPLYVRGVSYKGDMEERSLSFS